MNYKRKIIQFIVKYLWQNKKEREPFDDKGIRDCNVSVNFYGS